MELNVKALYEAVLMAEAEAKKEEAFALIRAIRNRQLGYLKEISKLDQQIKKLQFKYEKGEEKLGRIINGDLNLLYSEGSNSTQEGVSDG